MNLSPISFAFMVMFLVSMVVEKILGKDTLEIDKVLKGSTLMGRKRSKNGMFKNPNSTHSINSSDINIRRKILPFEDNVSSNVSPTTQKAINVTTNIDSKKMESIKRDLRLKKEKIGFFIEKNGYYFVMKIFFSPQVEIGPALQ